MSSDVVKLKEKKNVWFIIKMSINNNSSNYNTKFVRFVLLQLRHAACCMHNELMVNIKIVFICKPTHDTSHHTLFQWTNTCVLVFRRKCIVRERMKYGFEYKLSIVCWCLCLILHVTSSTLNNGYKQTEKKKLRKEEDKFHWDGISSRRCAHNTWQWKIGFVKRKNTEFNVIKMLITATA